MASINAYDGLAYSVSDIGTRIGIRHGSCYLGGVLDVHVRGELTIGQAAAGDVAMANGALVEVFGWLILNPSTWIDPKALEVGLKSLGITEL